MSPLLIQILRDVPIRFFYSNSKIAMIYNFMISNFPGLLYFRDLTYFPALIPACAPS